MVKEIDISATLLKEYKDKELIHYLAKQLRQMDSSYRAAQPEWALANYGAIMTDIAHLSSIATALDKKVNKDSSDSRVVML